MVSFVHSRELSTAAELDPGVREVHPAASCGRQRRRDLGWAMTARQELGDTAHLALGRRGEDVAARYLVDQGIVLLDRNWRCREGELDIIGTDGTTLLVYEVKTRSGLGYGAPAESITRDKIARIRRLTSQWLSEHNVRWCTVRFDVISILWRPGEPPEVRHIPRAF